MSTSPASLRRSLESRFKNASRTSDLSVKQLRRQFFHRCYLARVFSLTDQNWVLKGGVGLAVRVTNARHSEDLDLYRQHAQDELEDSINQLIAAGHPSDRDPFTFEVTRKNHIIGAAGGITLNVRCFLGAHELDLFPIDLTADQSIVGRLEEITPVHPIEIPEVQPPPAMRVYPIADQVADKLAAMYETYAHAHPSSRYRDLVDLVLITSDDLPLDPIDLVLALRQQQLHRNITIPSPLTPPGPHWTEQYPKLCHETPGVPEHLHRLDGALTHVEAALHPALRLLDSPG